MERKRSAVALGGLVALLGFGVGVARGDGGTPPEKPEREVGLVLTADRATYASGEPWVLTLRVVNEGSQPVQLTFRTAQRYDLLVRDAQGREVWRWGADKLFAQVLGEEALPPAGGAISYRVTVRQRFPPGRYTLTGIIPADEGPFVARATIEIR